MYLTSSITVLLYFLPFIESAPSNPRFVVHEKRDDLPHWRYEKIHTRDHVEKTIPLRIALAQRNLHKGYDFLMDVSHPDSENFGKHWTEEQVHDMFSPSQESVDTVKQWLVESGIDESRIKHIGGEADHMQVFWNQLAKFR